MTELLKMFSMAGKKSSLAETTVRLWRGVPHSVGFSLGNEAIYSRSNPIQNSSTFLITMWLSLLRPALCGLLVLASPLCANAKACKGFASAPFRETPCCQVYNCHYEDEVRSNPIKIKFYFKI